MSLWVECFAIINFDLDFGQRVECVVPDGRLSSDRCAALAHTAFPDSNPDCTHDFFFSFKLLDNDNRTPLYGYSYYRQKRDTSCPRGYVQQSVALLSRLPYLAVHEVILRVIAPRFGYFCERSPDLVPAVVSSCVSVDPKSLSFDSFTAPGYRPRAEEATQAQQTATPPPAPVESFQGKGSSQRDVLQKAVAEIVEEWPSPHPHVEYAMTLLGESISVVTPPRSTYLGRHVVYGPESSMVSPPRHAKLDQHVRLLGSRDAAAETSHFLPWVTLLGGHSSDLTKIWELLLVNEHLLVLSNTPSMCSAATLGLSSIISPVPFAGAVQPYFTVQHADFHGYMNLGKNESSPFPKGEGILIGCTNPYFVRAYSGWRNVMSVKDSGGAARTGTTPTSLQSPAFPTPVSSPNVSSSPTNGSPGIIAQGLAAAKAPVARRERWEALLGQFSEVFVSPRSFLVDHKSLTQELVSRLKQVGGASQVATEICNQVVAKYFLSLTNEFLSPLNSYFDTVAQGVVPFTMCCPTAKHLFVAETVMDHLEDEDVPLPDIFVSKRRSKILKMYEEFVTGKNFQAWIEHKIDTFTRHQLENLAGSGFPYTELQRIEMFVNLIQYAQREHGAADPDIVLLTLCTSVLAELAISLSDPSRTEFLAKVAELKI